VEGDVFPQLLARARALASGPRAILGIAGPPGSGKSTLAGALVGALGPSAALVPMDGFHLANAELARLGRSDRKGALDTFDVDGLLALLRRLRSSTSTIVYCPRFDRALEEAIAGAIPVAPEVALVVVEGNYLLLQEGRWREVRGLLDETWSLVLDPVVRRQRLIDRHVRYGRSRAQAEEWVDRSDERNAALIARASAAADVVIDGAGLGIEPSARQS
jgi:pantothenate kinase